MLRELASELDEADSKAQALSKGDGGTVVSIKTDGPAVTEEDINKFIEVLREAGHDVDFNMIVSPAENGS